MRKASSFELGLKAERDAEKLLGKTQKALTEKQLDKLKVQGNGSFGRKAQYPSN